jgi:outer membrane lipoprotein carrier protein
MNPMKHLNALSLLVALTVALPAAANPPSHPAASHRNAQTRTPTPRTPPRTQRPAAPAPRAPVVAQRPAPTPQPPTPQPPTPAVVPASPNGALTADQVAQRIQEFYDRTSDFQADFTQVSVNRLYGQEQRSGHVIFRKPGRMRWNYSAPHNDVIVSNGTTLTAYQAEERQAIQQTLTQSQMPTALAFLTGVGRLTDAFTFRLLDATQFQYPNGYVLELRPTTPQPTYERVVFYVDRATFQVARTVVIDAQGNRNQFTFLRPQVNLNVLESTFNWSPPAGTSVVTP